MHIEPEFSRLAGFTPEDDQPIIDTRRAITDVRVANRQTLVIGGLRQRTDNGSFNGVPGLKDVRVLGHLFRARDTDVRESELIVFIMPEIIGFDDPPKPRQMAAAETGLCKLNEVPVAEGCDPRCGDTRCEECGEGSSVLPADNGPIEFVPSPGPSETGVGEDNSLAPPHGGVTIWQDSNNRRLVRLPPTQPRRQAISGRTVNNSVVQIPTPPANRMRTAFDNRYRDSRDTIESGANSGESGSSQPSDSQPAKQTKGWWERVLRF